MILLWALVALAADPTERCFAGDAEACHQVATQAISQRPPNAQLAVDTLARGCDAGGASSCVMLGLLLAEGRIVNRDVDRATLLLTQQCEGHQPAACRGLGLLYLEDPAPAEQTKGASLLEDACNASDVPACAFLGDWFARQGPNVEALKFLSLACTGGFPYACSRVASFGFRKPDGTVEPEAFQTLSENCVKGEPFACSFLNEQGSKSETPPAP